MKRAITGENDYFSVMFNPALEAKKIRQRYRQESYDLLLKHTLKDFSTVVEEHDFPDEVNAACFRYNGIFVIGVNRNNFPVSAPLNSL